MSAVSNDLVRKYSDTEAIVQRVLGQDGSASEPAYSFTNDPDTGFYRPQTNRVVVALGGTDVVVFDGSFVDFLQRPRVPDGSSGTPGLAFKNAGNMGLYRVSGTKANWSEDIGIDGALSSVGAATLDTGGNGSSFGGDLEVKGDININPTNTYSPSNDSTDRTFDADSTSTAELADVLATLIKDLGMDA